MNRDEALKKIKKCLALARGAESHEAASAMRQAQKLMAEHRVTERELSMVDVHEVKVKATSTAANVWEVMLTNLVAESFGCETFTVSSQRFTPHCTFVRERHYIFAGLDSAPTIAGYAYEVLSRQCAKARLEHIRKQPKSCKPITKTARGDEFAKGWVYAVSTLIERFANPSRDAALLLAYIEAKHPNLKTTKSRDTTKTRRVAGHQWAGYKAGENATLDRGIGASAPAGLLS